jgi:hypothetical protein
MLWKKGGTSQPSQSLQYIQIQTANKMENTEGTNGQQLFQC